MAHMHARPSREPEHSFRGQPDPWNDYRQRRRWFWFAWLGCVPGVIAIAYPMHRWLRSDVPFHVVGFAWVGFFVIAAYRMNQFRCPRCGLPFFRTWWYSNSFAKHCVHCRLEKWTWWTQSG